MFSWFVNNTSFYFNNHNGPEYKVCRLSHVKRVSERSFIRVQVGRNIIGNNVFYKQRVRLTLRLELRLRLTVGWSSDLGLAFSSQFTSSHRTCCFLIRFCTKSVFTWSNQIPTVHRVIVDRVHHQLHRVLAQTANSFCWKSKPKWMICYFQNSHIWTTLSG